MDNINKLLKKYFTIIILLLVIIGTLLNKETIFGILDFWITVLEPILMGVFIAYLLNPIQKTINKYFHFKKDSINHILSIVVTYILFLGFVIILGIYCIPQIGESINDLITKIPIFYENLIDWISKYDISYLKDYEDEILNILSSFSESLSTLLPNIINWATNVIKFSINLIMAIFLSFCFLLEKNSIKNYLNKMFFAYLSENKFKKLKQVFFDCENILNKFIIGKAIDSLILAIICMIAMNVLGLNYVILMSTLVGITNMIPYVGPFIGGAIGFILLLVSSPKNAFIFLILIIVLQQFDGWILGPKILGGSVGVKPMWIIIAISIGGAIGGIVGMFLGVPVIAMIIYLVTNDIESKLKEKEINKKKKENVP